jgi:rubrerythrin
MVERYRCKNCGYYHVGPAPDVCPVCGAPKTAFEPYEGPGDLTGTRTLENLKAAFAGESQANRRYTLYKRIAELEGTEAAASTPITGPTISRPGSCATSACARSGS